MFAGARTSWARAAPRSFRGVQTVSDEGLARRADPDAHVLVVGGARGLGGAVASLLLDDSWGFQGRVSITSRNPHLVILPRTRTQSRVHKVLAMDVAQEDSVRSAAEAMAGERLDVLINCCGILHDTASDAMPEKKLADFDPEWFMRSVRTNAVGPALVMKHFAPLLYRRENERFTVIANLSARVGSIGDNRLGGWHTYRSSKAALNQLTRTAAIELRRKGVAVVSYHPGTVETDLSAPWQHNVTPSKLFTREHAARCLLGVIDSLDQETALGERGLYLDWDGKPIPW